MAQQQTKLSPATTRALLKLSAAQVAYQILLNG
jgi:hypothetical protein